MKTYSRIEVITEKGRVFSDWSEYTAWEQDGGRTLKLFKTLPEKKTVVGGRERLSQTGSASAKPKNGGTR